MSCKILHYCQYHQQRYIQPTHFRQGFLFILWKTPENQKFYDIFRNNKRTFVRNGLNWQLSSSFNQFNILMIMFPLLPFLAAGYLAKRQLDFFDKNFFFLSKNKMQTTSWQHLKFMNSFKLFFFRYKRKKTG